MYVIAPTPRATRLAHMRSRNSGASSPAISIFANEVSSNSAAVVRQATCSAPIAGDQSRPAQPRGRSDSSPRAAFGSNQLTRSQPDFSPKAAPSSCVRAYVADVRNGRPASRSWPGYFTS